MKSMLTKALSIFIIVNFFIYYFGESHGQRGL